MREKLIRWRYLGRLPLRLTYWRMEVGCKLRGHKWVVHYESGAPAAYCDRCFRCID